jgi:23S rRNA (uracil1939-C5)-methyltransferase
VPEVTLRWLLPDGAAGGPGPDGPVVVPGALPGDRVRYVEEQRRGRTILGRLDAVLAPAPERRAPPCPWTATCGGCDLDALPPEAQRAAKAGLLRHALRLPDAPPVRPSPRATGYRARIKLGVRDGDVGLHAARSHALVPIAACGIGRPELTPAIGALRDVVRATGGAGLSAVELRSDGERAAFAATSEGEVPRAVRDALATLGDVALDGRRLAGDPTRTLRVAGLALRASPRAFYQVNLELNEALVAAVCGHVAAARPGRILDLYAGIGNFSLPLAQATGAPVHAVELEGQALDDLRASAEAAGLADRVTTRGMAVEAFDPSREAFDVVVLDPPRAGAPGVVPRLLHNRPRRIVYVACHAPSATRDLKAAFDAGYTLTAVEGFDLFPDTHHVEALLVLDRGAGGARGGKPKAGRR